MTLTNEMKEEMTIEEAIDILEDIKFTSSEYPRDVEALEMAIEALKSKQWERVSAQ